MTEPYVEVVAYGERRAGAPTLVFLHEGLGSATQWRDFPEIIARDVGLAALAYSRVGYGKSAPVKLPRPLTYMQDEARDFLPMLLDEQGIESAILIGHSDGASIALVAASLHASRIRGVVVEAPHVFVEDISVASITKAREAYATTDLRDKLAKYHGENVDGAFHGWNDAWLDPEFRKWNLESYLPAITAPVLCIQGADDPYGTRAQVDAIGRQVSGPSEILIIAGCGHTPHREAFEVTREAMGRFVRGLPLARGGAEVQ